MEKFILTFWKEPYNSKSSFVKEVDDYLTSALVTVSENDGQKIFHIKLTDIGLDSKFGEFDIFKRDLFWKTSDRESEEFLFLKSNIISALILCGR